MHACDMTNIPWRTLAGFCLLSLVLAVYYLLHPGTHTQYIFTVSLLGILYPLAAGLLCCKGSLTLIKRHPEQGGRRFSPALLGLGMIAFAFAEAIWFDNTVNAQPLPIFPAPQHFVSFLSYPFIISAILLLPAHPLTWLARLRLLLDGLIIMEVVTILCYYFILAPILLAGQGTPFVKGVAGLFPLADLIALFCLVLVSLRFSEKALRPVLLMLGLAMVSLFIDHEAHIADILNYQFNQLAPANALLFLTAILMVGAAQTICRILEKGGGRASPTAQETAQTGLLYQPGRWRTLLPSALLLIFGLFILGIWFTGAARHFHGQILIVYVGGFAVLLLMASRQFLIMHEMNILRRELQRKNRSLYALNIHLEQRATSDPLTGLPNHRALVERLNEELARASTTHTPCALLFIDIDYFKGINDKHGHLIGDRVLQDFALLIQRTLRAGDYIGRWGGEEFVVILPGINSSSAFVVAERLRYQVAQQGFLGSAALRLTCSLGVAAYPEDATERKNLLARADRAMYAAKRLGRNQTRMARDPEVLAIRLARENAPLSENVDALGTVKALLFLQHARDHATALHERRVSELALTLARALGLSQAEAYTVSLAGLLHELGTIALPDALLLDYPHGRTRESAAVHQHPLTCARVLRSIPALQDVATIVAAHHEKMDGSGYPEGLQGEAIPLGARIVAVASAYDLMTHNRARTCVEALNELQKNTGSQFDARVVEALARLLAAHPQQPVGKPG